MAETALCTFVREFAVLTLTEFSPIVVIVADVLRFRVFVRTGNIDLCFVLGTKRTSSLEVQIILGLIDDLLMANMPYPGVRLHPPIHGRDVQHALILRNDSSYVRHKNEIGLRLHSA